MLIFTQFFHINNEIFVFLYVRNIQFWITNLFFEILLEILYKKKHLKNNLFKHL